MENSQSIPDNKKHTGGEEKGAMGQCHKNIMKTYQLLLMDVYIDKYELPNYNEKADRQLKSLWVKSTSHICTIQAAAGYIHDSVIK